MEDWHRRRCEGLVKTFVARGKRSLPIVFKTLHTAVRKGQITRQELEDIMAEVENRSVKPFANRPDYLERVHRYNELKQSLGF